MLISARGNQPLSDSPGKVEELAMHACTNPCQLHFLSFLTRIADTPDRSRQLKNNHSVDEWKKISRGIMAYLYPEAKLVQMYNN